MQIDEFNAMQIGKTHQLIKYNYYHQNQWRRSLIAGIVHRFFAL